VRLQPYRFKVQYIPGKQNIADPLSRVGKGKGVCMNDDAEEFIQFVAETSTPTAMSVEEVEEESWLDPEISQLRECITTGEWDSAPPQYKAVRSELSILGKLVLRRIRLLVPTKLGDRVVDLAHEGHQGLTKTKQRLCNMPGGLELIDKLKKMQDLPWLPVGWFAHTTGTLETY